MTPKKWRPLGAHILKRERLRERAPSHVREQSATATSYVKREAAPHYKCSLLLSWKFPAAW